MAVEEEVEVLSQEEEGEEAKKLSVGAPCEEESKEASGDSKEGRRSDGS